MRIRSITTLVALALVLAACGGTAGDNRNTSEDTLDPPSESAATAAPETSIVEAESVEASPTSTSTTVGLAEEADSVSDAESESSRQDAGDDSEDAPGETVPTSEPGGAVTGEVPQAFLDAVITDASSQSDLPVGELTVLRAEYVEWADGSLGCPEPGVFYTQAVTPGYWVEIGAGDRTLDYRIGENGLFRLCGGVVTPHGGDDAGGGTAGGDS